MLRRKSAVKRSAAIVCANDEADCLDTHVTDSDLEIEAFGGESDFIDRLDDVVHSKSKVITAGFTSANPKIMGLDGSRLLPVSVMVASVYNLS